MSGGPRPDSPSLDGPSLDGPNLDGLRIGLLTSSASRRGGGVFEAVAGHAELIASMGGEAPVFALADAYSETDAGRFAAGTVTHLPIVGPAMFGFAPALVRTLVDARLDILHLHGIWMYPSRAATRWTRKTGKPYIVSPHGMLEKYIVARGRMKKAAGRIGYERASWRAAHRLHALTPGEAADIVREAGPRNIVVIPNAAPPVTASPVAPRLPVVLFLGRLHPQKNLDGLIKAWRSIDATVRETGARLVIAGWGQDAHVAELKTLLAAQDDDGIEFVGPLFGDAKARALAEARWAALPSLSEGLPMAMLEAWAAGTPTIMSSGCNLPLGFERGAALECGTSPTAIAPVLARALTMDDDGWASHAQAARTLASGPFAPATIAARWANTYRALIAESPR